MPILDENRLFPIEPAARRLARDLYETVRDLPIVSPHGHCDPRWFAENERFSDPAHLFVVPDHYVFRMLFSQGFRLEDLGLRRRDGGPVETDPRRIWRRFAAGYRFLRGTPSRLWLDHAFASVFGIEAPLTPATADDVYDRIEDCLARPEYRPRALYDRFSIEVLATTDSALDDLRWHRKIAESGWGGTVIPTYRPDAVVDPAQAGFRANVERLGELAGCDATTWEGYLEAHRLRRAVFRAHGATASDHGHPSCRTENLPQDEAAALFARALSGEATPAEAEAFRGQMLTEMARMSLDDGLVLQIHPGSVRGHSDRMAADFGPDVGFDIPARTGYVHALRPLLEAVGHRPEQTVIHITHVETNH